MCFSRNFISAYFVCKVCQTYNSIIYMLQKCNLIFSGQLLKCAQSKKGCCVKKQLHKRPVGWLHCWIVYLSTTKNIPLVTIEGALFPLADTGKTRSAGGELGLMPSFLHHKVIWYKQISQWQPMTHIVAHSLCWCIIVSNINHFNLPCVNSKHEKRCQHEM